MWVVQEGKQNITLPMFLELALHRKQPPEIVTYFKLAEI